jgi:hypothetical protein
MPKYELRKGGKVVERTEVAARGHEDTRLGLAAADNKSNTDGWVLVEAWTDPKTKTATAVEGKA